MMDCCMALTSLLLGSVRGIAYRHSKSGGAREIESRWWKAIGKKRMARWHLSIWAAFEARIMKRRLAASPSRSRTTVSEKGGKKGRDAYEGAACQSQPARWIDEWKKEGERKRDS